MRNKKLKELQKKMANCQKGSRQWKKYRRALNDILGKIDYSRHLGRIIGLPDGGRLDKHWRNIRCVG
ncbi:hypothetical protein [Desulfosporosinus shakirovi]|uniref:hypothetical protein n=1 Tax=Desulfosporosinus shakirovi TaxID=2885154 RepID=UPI001E364C5E|nr:hypothetical protein [Desulfosporosinus sp. SRJS8]MCB8815339.1 hypothetical protein [Desulfosporosinus sp. SRJS8]